MIRIITSFIFIVFFLNGCLSEEQKQTIKNNRVELGNVKINYFSDKSVTSLEIPPDLTSPSYENSFRISELVSDIDQNTVNLTNNPLEIKKEKKILSIPDDITVKKSGNRRWLVINKNPDLVWSLSSQFLKENGFIIKKSNRKIGVMETDFLENKPEIPAQSLGVIRSFFASTIDNVSYTLPTVDKYKIRIEPLESGQKTELHLSLYSMAEVITSSGKIESSMWQSKEKDYSLEAEMLYSLMIYLGSDSAEAREKIINAKETNKINVKVADSINGYAKLVFNLNLAETWDNMAWAISESNIELDDKDVKEKTFYINIARSSDKGVLTFLFGDDAQKMPFQIQLKSINSNETEVYFNDISEVNESDTKEFSYELFNKIQKLF